MLDIRPHTIHERQREIKSRIIHYLNSNREQTERNPQKKGQPQVFRVIQSSVIKSHTKEQQDIITRNQKRDVRGLHTPKGHRDRQHAHTVKIYRAKLDTGLASNVKGYPHSRGFRNILRPFIFCGSMR